MGIKRSFSVFWWWWWLCSEQTWSTGIF